jgi:cytochrome P450
MLWLFYFLAKYQDMQKRVQEEIDHVLGHNFNVNDVYSYDQLKDLTFLRNMVNETLRIYPPIIRSCRRCHTR